MALHQSSSRPNHTNLPACLQGFGGRVLAYDVVESQDAKEAGATYEDLETVLRESDFVSLHVPLLPATFHIINSERWAAGCT